MTTLQHVGTPIDVPCQAEDCDVHTTVWVDGGEVTGYRPHCQHQQRWTYISEAAQERMAEAGSSDVTPGPGTGSTVEPLEATGSGEPPAEAARSFAECRPLWTTDLPTEPGWYWWQDSGLSPRIERVEEHAGSLWVWEDIPVGEMGGLWAGPIMPPGEGS